MIRLTNVNKYFFKGRPNEIHVINDISLELPRKGLVALFGKSGCGKTTLLNTIGGLDKFKDGEIAIDGKSIRKHTDDIRNQYIGYIFQNYNLNLQVNIFENVAQALRLCGFGDEEEIARRVQVALANVGMEKYIHRMPDTLSGGQKQRVAIARAIVKNPAIILADEPTGNLDEKNTLLIMDLLKSISKDHLVLLVTHENHLVDYYCDQVIELSDGKVINVRENRDANGYVAREKNVVYLGELEKKTLAEGQVSLDYYGEPCEEKINIQLVNHNGVVMLKVNSPKIKLLEEGSEVVFCEGVFEAKAPQPQERVDLSELPPVSAGKCGRLFTFANSAKESFHQLLAPQKKTNKGLRRVMMFFAILITMVVAINSKWVKELIKADESYNHNTFYVFATDNERVRMLYEAAQTGEYGIDYVTLTNGISMDYDLSVNGDLFESFKDEAYQYEYYMTLWDPLAGHGVLLPHRLASSFEVCYGKNVDLGSDEIVITKRLAEIFVENSRLGFVHSIKDLIGLSLRNIDGKIVGIVDNEEPVAYLANPEDYLRSNGDLFAEDGTKILYDGSGQLQSGEIIYCMEATDEARAIGDTVELYGKSFTIVAIEMCQTGDWETILEKYLGIPVRVLYAEPSKDSWVFELEMEGMTFEYQIEQEELMAMDVVLTSSYKVSYADYGMLYDSLSQNAVNSYMMVHTTDEKATDYFLQEHFSDSSLPMGVSYSLVTPHDIGKQKTDRIWGAIRGAIFSFAVLLSLLCFCMYLLMRSNVMSRVREIGVYRCIGVSSRNVKYRFMVESFMLTTLSVLPGYLFVVGLILYMNHGSALAMNIFLPFWISVPVLVFLYAVCVLFGTLPTIFLLRKTPSEIMAKYDV